MNFGAKISYIFYAITSLSILISLPTVVSSENTNAYKRGTIRGATSRCLDVKQECSHYGTPLITWDCHSYHNQQFIYLSNDNTIRVYGKCLDPGIGSKNGNFARIWDCHGQSHQKWLLTPSGEIVNVRGNNCLHETSSGVYVLPCDGSVNQRWTFHN